MICETHLNDLLNRHLGFFKTDESIKKEFINSPTYLKRLCKNMLYGNEYIKESQKDRIWEYYNSDISKIELISVMFKDNNFYSKKNNDEIGIIEFEGLND